jgi:hypothetical protein
MNDDLETQEELETINNLVLDLPRTNREVPMVLLSDDGYIPDDQIAKELDEDDAKR